MIAGLSAHIKDYAFMVWGLLELYQATFEMKYLRDALKLNEQMLAHFWDEQNGGLYMTADNSESCNRPNREPIALLMINIERGQNR